MFSIISSGSHGLGRSPMLAWVNIFIRIQATNPEATNRLALMSSLDRTDISFSLLRLHTAKDFKLRSQLGLLADYHLATPLEQGTVYTMPPLVQIAGQNWLHQGEKRLHWQCQALSPLFQAYEKAATDSGDSPVRAYPSQLQLLPHLDILLRYCKHIYKDSAPYRELVSPELVPALICFASLYIWEGRSKAVKILLYRVLNAQTIAIHLHSKDTEIDILSALALNYVEDSWFKLAEAQKLKVVGFRELQYPPGREGIQGEVVEARLRLSKIYYLRGKDMRRREACYLERARVLQEKLLAEMEKRGRVDIDWTSKLCEVQAAVARTYYAQGKLEKALQWAKKAHEGRLKVFGKYDLATLGVEQDLAFCLAEVGKDGEAVKLFDRVKRLLEEKFESGHFEARKCEERRRRMLERFRQKLQVSKPS
ncbi:hypothetical protein BDZ45DRAFT_728799 [Acephala macrosclerotiorum]|nr:hypothetical protein BDZ45DRAFT_728799 [Acephala macrosclerotiorum]